MMTRRVFMGVVAAGLLAWALAAPAAASEQEKAQLRGRFKERYPALKQLKADRFIGETAEGYVAAVRDQPLDERATRLVNYENRDRRRLYAILAAELGTEVETVARRNAQRNFDQAAQGEYLRDAEGRWGKKP